MFLLAIVFAVWALPALIDLFRAFGYGAVTIGGHYYGVARQTVIRYTLIYLGVLTFLSVASAIAMATQETFFFAIFMFLIGCVLLPLQGVLNKSISLVNHVLPQGSKLSDPKVITVSILVSINLGIVALLFPGAYYSWYGIFFLALLMVGVAVMVSFPSDRFLSKMVLGGMTVATFALWIVMAIFPTEIEAAVNWRHLGQANSGRTNVAEMLKVRPVQTITSKEGASVWTVKKRWNGDPVLRSDGFPEVEPLNEANGEQKLLVVGTKFKASNIEVKGLDAGEPLVQIFLAAKDGSWVQTGKAKDMYIAVSKTDLPTTQIASSNTMSPSGNIDTSSMKVVKTGEVPVTVAFTNVGTYSGKILIQMNGIAKLDATRENFGPKGWVAGGSAPAFFALPGATMMSAIAKVNGKIVYVGDSLQLDLPASTTIEIGPNEDTNQKDGAGLKDNGGSWGYTISAPK